MGAKPSTLPRWADVGGAIVVPSSGKLDVGWVSAERPPAQYLNWYQNLVYLWIVFVGAYFTNGGAATGATDLGHVAEATNTPMSVWRDYNQKIRTVIDHNGYRMGQVSELDEHWLGDPVTVHIPLVTGVITQGAPTYSGATTGATNGQWKFTGASQTVHFALAGHVPKNATITSILVKYIRTTGSDSFVSTVYYDSVTSGDSASSSLCTQTVSSGTGAGSIDLCTGGEQFTVNSDSGLSFNGDMFIRISTTAVTTADWIVGIEVTYTLPPVGWYAKMATNGRAARILTDRYAYTNPDTDINQRSMSLESRGVTGVAGGTEFLGPFEAFHNANCAYVMEFMLRTGAITDGGANARIIAAGVQNNNGGALDRFVYLYNQNTTANWQLRVVGSSTADTDTGVAIAANTTYRVRLEIYGSAVNSSGNTKIRLFINGAEVAEVNSTTLPASDMIRPYFKVGTTATGANGPYNARVGRVRRVWNHLLTSDNL